jgi:hypothetical protein
MSYKFEYNGETVYGRTSDSFTKEELIKKGETIEIKYYNGKSIEASYTKDETLTTKIIFGSVFVGIAGVLIILAIVNYSKVSKYNKLAKNGRTFRVKVDRSHVDHTMNGSPRYKIGYILHDEMGNENLCYSLGVFTAEQTKYLESLDKISVIYDGKSSLIVENLNNTQIHHQIVEPIRETNDIKMYECEHCGDIVEPDEMGICPTCGKEISEYIIRNK